MYDVGGFVVDDVGVGVGYDVGVVGGGGGGVGVYVSGGVVVSCDN